MTTTIVEPITYPAYPKDGGPLESAFKKFGDWFISPKVNGWCALVHTETGTMFNRHLQPSTIESAFEPVLDSLRGCPMPWLHCEAFERRHALGKGSLVILDVPERGTSRERYDHLLDVFGERLLDIERPADPNTLYLMPQVIMADPMPMWTHLKELNREFGVEYYEGIVAKLTTSLYPIQRASDNRNDPFWVKHRWQW